MFREELEVILLRNKAIYSQIKSEIMVSVMKTGFEIKKL